VLLSKQLLLYRLLDVTCSSVSEFVSSLCITSSDDRSRETYFKTSIVFDSQTGLLHSSALYCHLCQLKQIEQLDVTKIASNCGKTAAIVFLFVHSHSDSVSVQEQAKSAH